MVRDLRVMALLRRSERLRVGEGNNFGCIVCDAYEFVSIGGSSRGKETRGEQWRRMS